MHPSPEQATESRVVDNADKSRFEIYVGDELAGFVRYRRDGSLLRLVHTEVDPAHQGAGLAGKLARASLDSARKRGLSVLPICPYVKSWIGKHPEYAELVPADRRAGFGL